MKQDAIMRNVKSLLHRRSHVPIVDRRKCAVKKLDEMERNLQLRSEEWGYKTVLLALCIWTVFNIYQAVENGTELNMLPCLILCLSVCVQGFTQIVMKRNMIAGDEDDKEPNRLLQTVVAGIVLVAVILSVGAYFLLKK